MRPNSRVREPGGAGVRRFPAVVPIVLGLLTLAACATTVAGTAAPAVTVLPSAPSPVPPSLLPTSTAVSPTGVTPTGPTPTLELPTTASPITQPSVTTDESSTMTASDPSTETLTVVSAPGTSVRPTSTAGPSSAATTVSRLTVSHSSEHRGTAKATGDGIVVVNKAAPVKIEIYAEPLCPPCAEFAAKNGPAIDTAIDNSELAVTYRTLAFLDPVSASRTYSTRASAALYCVATKAGSQPGLFQDFYAVLFDPENQPEENGSKDLTDNQLAKLAAGVGAPQSVLTCIVEGTEGDTATAADAAGQKSLARAGGTGTPTVTSRGKIVDHNQQGWLDDLLGG